MRWRGVRSGGRIGRFAILAAFLPVLAACATPAGAPTAPAADTAPSGPAGGSGAGPSAPGGARPASPVAAGTETISGTVTAGVENGCLILRDADGSHLLIFHDPALQAAARPGTRVTVVGRVQPDLMSYCQQGVPFVVSSIRGN